MSNLAALWEHFHFLRPLWLLSLPLAFLPWWWMRRVAGTSAWASLVDPHLLPYLLAEPRAASRPSGALIAALTLMLLILALAGPAFRLAPQAEVRREAAVVLAFDLSQGMLAADVAPDRLSQARYELTDLLRARADGQTALVAYAGDAFTVAPLTDDAATLQSLLGALSPEVMPVAGQRPVRALQRAAELIEQAGMPGGDVLLVTYRADPPARAKAAELAAAGVRVSMLLVGTDAGAPVPALRGGFQEDGRGGLMLARRDLASARELAAAGGGIMVEASAGAEDAERLQAFWESTAGRLGAQEGAGSQRYVDEGPWLLLIALLPLLWLLRRAAALRGAGLLLVLAATALSAPPAAAADSLWDRLWARADQRAWSALRQDDPARARALADSADLRAAAAFREGDYAAAAEEFSRAARDARGHYNEGTALARAGRLDEAKAAFDAALAEAPDMADALYNRDLVEQALAQQQAEQAHPQDSKGEQGGASSSSGQDEPGENPRASADAEPDSGQSGGEESTEQDIQGEPGQSARASGDAAPQAGDAQREAQAAEAQRRAMEQALAEGAEAPDSAAQAAHAEQIEASEQQQATDQLLRQIPDDPGALLRRKFALEHRRRVMEGAQE